jgi:methylated-DNA-[protein]-cysteine S-methyltransferase
MQKSVLTHKKSRKQANLGRTLAPRHRVVSNATVFATHIGWVALMMRDKVLQRLSFGHRGADSAAAALGLDDDCILPPQGAGAELAERLTRYAAGEWDEFLDVEVEITHLSWFAARVVQAVRQIPFGQTCSYGELAARVGRPRAARAVGGVMAKNRTPLVVPCHRVLGGGGAIGGFSAVDGVRMKRRLLDLEAETLANVR